MNILFGKILSSLLLVFVLASCSTVRPKGKTEAEVLFLEAKFLIEDGRYLMATEKLNSIRSQFPYSYYATHAELLQADILFEQDNYVEAAAAYILFKDFHPRHKKMAYVVWRIAESFNNQRPPTYDRDLSPLYEAWDSLVGIKDHLIHSGLRCLSLAYVSESSELKRRLFLTLPYHYCEILESDSDYSDLETEENSRLARSLVKKIGKEVSACLLFSA